MHRLCLLLIVLFCWQANYAQSANFTASTTSGCSPMVVNFTNQSSGNIVSYFWTFGNGGTSTLANPSATFFSPGVYTVTLTVTDANNNSNTITRTNYIEVYGKPVVNFTVNDSTACFPHNAQFTDLSTAASSTSNVTFVWDFGDGFQSNAQNPSHTYTAAGNYTVNLKITNDKGCVAVMTKQAYIKINGGITSDFTSTPPVVCRPPFNIQFTGQASGPATLSYTWDFGDGNGASVLSPAHIYTAPGNYTVKLITTSSAGCKDTLIKPNFLQILNIQTQFSTPDSICYNDPVLMQNTSTPQPASSNWTFGDNNGSGSISPTHNYSTAGIYTIRLVNTYSYCSDSFSKSIKVLPRPTAGFTANPLISCKPPLAVNFTDQSTNGVSWFWDFGDGSTSTQQNPPHTYLAYGNFTVKQVVYNSSGCPDSLIRTDYVKIEKPLVNILGLPAKGCIPYTFIPNPAVTTLDNVTSWHWEFGDGGTANVQNPSHVYTVQGIYNVKLVITTSTGCTDSVLVVGGVKVGRKPIVDFTAVPNPVCAFESVKFTNLTNESDIWEWHFSDGSSSSLQNPLHEFSDTGYIDVKLVVENNGCRDSLERLNYIYVKPPISRWYYRPNCDNKLLFSFRDSSIGATTWFWDFGDGTTDTARHPVHIFPAFGTYQVTLTVTNDTCEHSKTIPIKVIDINPDFVANMTTACKSAYILFTSQSGDASLISSYDWVTGNNSVAPHDPIIQVYYDSSAYYSIQLITTDIYGCKDTAFKPNYIRINGPTASFTGTGLTGCIGLTSTFNASQSHGDGISSITGWKFDFGDGNSQSFNADPSPISHTYQNAGTFNVKLIVTDAGGCKDSLTLPNLVTATDPTVDFVSADTLACPGSTVNFTNLSNASNYTSVWTFGNTQGSQQTNPSTVYTNTGLYTVSLTITDQYGCVRNITKPNYIKVDRPFANMSLSDSISSCTPFEVTFTNTSTYYSGYVWDLAIGPSVAAQPTGFYNTPGVYTIKLEVTSPGGCKDSTFRHVYVYDTAGARIDYYPLSGCKPLLVNLHAYSPGPMTYTWDFGDGVVENTIPDSTKHIYNYFGEFVPKAIMIDPAGCIIPVTGIDTIRIKGAYAKFGLDQSQFCDSGFVNFIDSTTFNDSIAVYHWDFGDGTTSNLQTPQHNYAGQGLYTVTLAVQTMAGCVDTFRLPNVVKVVNSPLISIGGDSVICIDQFLRHLGVLDRADTAILNWTWKFPNGNGSTLQNPVLQQYGTAGTFQVTTIATNGSGCKDTAVKTIYVNPLPTVTMPGVLTMQTGFPVKIPAVYSPNTASWNWRPGGSLDCTDCPQPVAGPKFNTTYFVSFVDSNGCRNTGKIDIVVICKNANVFIPNTFSPNGDGANDVFYIRGKGLDRVKSLRVFNRWGQVVFERANFPVNDASYGWDGRFKGNKPQPDVYVYQAELFCENGEVILLDGNVALIQ